MKTRNSVPGVDINARHAEAGSAYLATLLVLVVLTILGLSLAVITQTEVLIGGSEKQATRQLYAAGSGVDISTVYELVHRAPASREMEIASSTANLYGQETVICWSPFFEIAANPCDLCALNSDPPYAAMQYGVTVNAMRRGDSTLAARKTVGAVVTFEPYPLSFEGLRFGGGEPLATKSPLIDIDPTTEVDPCEGLFLKI